MADEWGLSTGDLDALQLLMQDALKSPEDGKTEFVILRKPDLHARFMALMEGWTPRQCGALLVYMGMRCVALSGSCGSEWDMHDVTQLMQQMLWLTADAHEHLIRGEHVPDYATGEGFGTEE